MSKGNSIGGNEFDEWMNPDGKSSVNQSVPQQEEVVVDADVVRPGKSGRNGKTPSVMPKIKKMVFIGMGAVGLVAVCAPFIVKNHAKRAAAVDPEIAAIMASAAEVPAEVSEPQTAAVGQQETEPAAAEAMAEGAGAASLVTLQLSEPEMVAVAEPAKPAIPVAAAVQAPPPELDARDREISALKEEVKRAIAARNRAEVAEHRSKSKSRAQASFTVVATLADGVVIRDSAGKERVVAIGNRVTL